MATAIDAASLTVVTATGLEASAARRALPPSVRVVRGGVALRGHQGSFGECAISCGVAGGLRTDLPTGTVLIPSRVRCPDGSIRECDPDVVSALLSAARALGHDPVDDPMVTSSTLLHAGERQTWSARGYAGVDMETGIIDARRVACVRVILDTPQREISPVWGNPATVVFYPSAWRDLPFLAREGPRCAAIAAKVIAQALRQRP
jgi:hypothetical protein